MRASVRVCLPPPFLCCTLSGTQQLRPTLGSHSQQHTERSHNASAFQRLPSREAVLLQQGLSYQEVTRPTLRDNTPQCTEAAPIETTHLGGRLMPRICQPANNSPLPFLLHPSTHLPSIPPTLKSGFLFFSHSQTGGRRVVVKGCR